MTFRVVLDSLRTVCQLNTSFFHLPGKTFLSSSNFGDDRWRVGTAGLVMDYKLGPRWDDVITWSDFKSETIFGFLSPNYTGQHT